MERIILLRKRSKSDVAGSRSFWTNSGFRTWLATPGILEGGHRCSLLIVKAFCAGEYSSKFVTDTKVIPADVQR